MTSTLQRGDVVRLTNHTVVCLLEQVHGAPRSGGWNCLCLQEKDSQSLMDREMFVFSEALREGVKIDMFLCEEQLRPCREDAREAERKEHLRKYGYWEPCACPPKAEP